jgi:hypothetical protein
MMYVESLKLLHTLHAQRERERSESIEPDDDAAATADGAFRAVPFNERPAHSAQDTSAIQNSSSLTRGEYRRYT